MPCAPLGGVLASLGVDAIDFASVDVEGSELTVLRSLLSRHDRPSLGVVLVEVRMDGQREPIMELMLGAGLRYVGQITGRPSPANEVISDCFVNLTHVATRFGASRAFVRGDATRPTGRSCPSVPTWWFQGRQPNGYGETAEAAHAVVRVAAPPPPPSGPGASRHRRPNSGRGRGAHGPQGASARGVN